MLDCGVVRGMREGTQGHGHLYLKSFAVNSIHHCLAFGF